MITSKMISIKENPLYRLYFFLSKRRKRQLYFLIFLLIINGIFESFSIAIIIPFISIISMQNELNKIPIINKITQLFGINDISQSLLLITIIFCILVSLSTFFRLFNMKYIINYSANLEIELSRKIFYNNIYQSYLNYTKRNSSEVITITIEKVSSAASAICSFLTLMGSAVLGFFILISLILINWQVVFAGIIFLIIYYLIIYKRVKRILILNGKSLASSGPKRLRMLQEVFYGFRDLIVNGTEKIYISMFNKIDSEIKFRTASSAFISIFPRYLIEGLIIVILAIAGYNISLSKFNLLTLIPLLGSMIYCFQRLLPLLQQIYATWANYRTKYPGICEVVEELENNQITKKADSSTYDLKFKDNIIFRNINFSYQKSIQILKDVNFSISKGEFIGIYGETGSGKSTFLDILIGLLPPSKGTILIDNVDIYKNNSNFQWTSKIAHVSQNIYLKEGTIAENIAYGYSLEDIDIELLIKVSKLANLYDFIKKTANGFKSQVGERGIRLSGGQRQRIAIARALYKCREVLVLDEATSALDNDTEKKIIDSIKKNNSATIFMVTHRLKSLSICDRVFKVSDNKITEEKSF